MTWRKIRSGAGAAGRRVRWAVVDAIDLVRGRRRVPDPPREMVVRIGGSNYRLHGELFFRLFRDVGGLRRDDRVLDVGCGCGRMAVPLTRWLRGPYQGFDVDEGMVRWCTETITPRHPRFAFRAADLRNGFYRPDGAGDASRWTFPWPDASFDFVFLTSVFTHMLPPAQERYVSEISRVLADGGRCFATFFLWNEDAEARVARGRRLKIGFPFLHDGFRSASPDAPEGAVAFPESDVRDRLARHDLEVVEPIHPGSWCRKDGLSLQDVVVARRRAR